MDTTTPRSGAEGGPQPDGHEAPAPPRPGPPRRPVTRRDPWPVRHLWASLANAAGFVCLISLFAAFVDSPWWGAVAVVAGGITSMALRRST